MGLLRRSMVEIRIAWSENRTVSRLGRRVQFGTAQRNPPIQPPFVPKIYFRKSGGSRFVEHKYIVRDSERPQDDLGNVRGTFG